MNANDISKKFANIKPHKSNNPAQRRRLPDKTQIAAKRKLSTVAAIERQKAPKNHRDPAGIKASKMFAAVPLLADAPKEDEFTEEQIVTHRGALTKLAGHMPHKTQLELSKTLFEEDVIDPVIEGHKMHLQALKSVAPKRVTMGNHTLSSPIGRDPSRMPMPEIAAPLTVERRFDPSRKKSVPVIPSKEPRIILSHYYASQDNKFVLRSI